MSPDQQKHLLRQICRLRLITEYRQGERKHRSRMMGIERIECLGITLGYTSQQTDVSVVERGHRGPLYFLQM
jgi:hypothetical protein